MCQWIVYDPCVCVCVGSLLLAVSACSPAACGGQWAFATGFPPWLSEWTLSSLCFTLFIKRANLYLFILFVFPVVSQLNRCTFYLFTFCRMCSLAGSRTRWTILGWRQRQERRRWLRITSSCSGLSSAMTLRTRGRNRARTSPKKGEDYFSPECFCTFYSSVDCKNNTIKHVLYYFWLKT